MEGRRASLSCRTAFAESQSEFVYHESGSGS